MTKTGTAGLLGGICVAAVSWLWFFSNRAATEREEALWQRLTKVQSTLSTRPDLAPALNEVRDALVRHRLEAAADRLSRVERRVARTSFRPPNQRPAGAPAPLSPAQETPRPGSRRDHPAASRPTPPDRRPVPGNRKAERFGPVRPPRRRADGSSAAGREQLLEFVSKLPPQEREKVIRETIATGAALAQSGNRPADREKAARLGRELETLIRRARQGRTTTSQYLSDLDRLRKQVARPTRRLEIASRPRHQRDRTQGVGRPRSPRSARRRAGPESTPGVPPLPPLVAGRLAGFLGAREGELPVQSTARLSNRRLEVTVDSATGALTVTDEVTGQTWRSVLTDETKLRDVRVHGDSLTARLDAGFPCDVRLTLPKTGSDLHVELTPPAVLTPGDTARPLVRYPPPFITSPGGHLALPRSTEPSFVPVSSGGEAWLATADLTAPWFGYADPKGGYVIRFEAPSGWKAALHVTRQENGCRTAGLVWRGAPEALGKRLSVTIRYTSARTFPGLAQVYRLLVEPLRRESTP